LSRSSTEVGSPAEPDDILVGEVLRAHGIRGDVVVRPYTENPARFQPGATIRIGRDQKSAEGMVVAAVRTQQPGRLLVGFDPPLDRTGAEALRGARVFAAPTDLPPLPDGSYWESDLIGLAVVDATGARLGTIAGVLSRAEQDLWEVETPDGAVLLPASRGIVVSVDLAGRAVTVDPPAGLF
jgi:16S rRNA processing protein RimM